jgi:hypothetical protein
MKVTISKYLNARIGESSTHAACQFYQTPGKTIEIDDVLVGESIDGNSIWYHCKDDGCYYWAGGIAEESIGLQIFAPPIELKSKPVDFQYKLINNALSEFTRFFDQQNISALLPELVDGEVILVVCSNKPISSLPDVILFHGYLIRVRRENTRIITPHTPIQIFQDVTEPLVMGGSLAYVSADERKVPTVIGTRGLKLYLNNTPVLLTCYHVACIQLMSQRKSEFENTEINISIPSFASHPAVATTSGTVTNGRLKDFYDRHS